MNDRRALAILFLVVVIDLLGFGFVLPLLSRYGERLGASGWTLGLLVSCFSIMQLVGSPLWGSLSDRIGRRPVLIVGLAGSVVFYGIFALASYWEHLVLLFVSRIGAGLAGATIATAQAYIADCTPPERRTSGMALIGAAFGIGFVLGPMIGAAAMLAEAPGDRLSPIPGLVASGISLVAFVTAMAFLPEPPQRAHRTVGPRLAVPWGRIPLVTGILIGAFFIANFAFAEFESTISLLNERAFGLSDRANYGVFIFIGAVVVVTQAFITRRLNRIISDRAIAATGSACMALGSLLLMAAASWQSLTLAFPSLATLVFGSSLMFPSLQSLISRNTPADRQGEVLGINQGMSALGRILGQTIGLPLLDRSLALPFQVSAVLAFVALVVTLAAGGRPESNKAQTSESEREPVHG